MTPQNQLDLRTVHPDYQRFLDINEGESQRVAKSYSCHLNQKYGDDPLQAIDIFPSELRASPILIFIHGGYWRALDKMSYRFVAEPFVKENFTVCVVNYRLIPMVNMETLLQDIRDAIRWIQQKANLYNGDPNAMILSGHSAGGHLALMAYLMNQNLRSSITAICSLSGIFDLAPIRNSYLNETLKLTKKEVEDFSVSNMDLSVLTCPTLLSVGSDETNLFIEQSKDLYTQYTKIAPLEYHEYGHLNHYQIVHQLGKKESPLVQFIFDNRQKTASDGR
ncbi:MAG: alpha/beta hydrolase [Saprospiraceae bacterium]|nr:alpha/beta hydrolase [Saprospiraceae bacterium]